MKIAVVGAGLSGLTAGKILASSGHEVVVYEKSRGFGGRMATRYAGKDLEYRLDHGVSHFSATDSTFKTVLEDWKTKGLVQEWGQYFSYFNGEKLLPRTPLEESNLYTSTTGMNQIGRYMGRICDVVFESKIGGITYFGENRTRKKPWILNFQSGSVVSADAVIISTPAPQAYGVLGMTQDETDTFKMVRRIDEIHYQSAFTLMIGFKGIEIPSWQGIECENSIISFISNESLKRNEKDTLYLTVKSTYAFSQLNQDQLKDQVAKLLIQELSGILGGWVKSYDWKQIHFWRYAHCENPLDTYYLERENMDAPLALIGDYFKGSTLQDAFLSGYELGQQWKKKFQNRIEERAA